MRTALPALLLVAAICSGWGAPAAAEPAPGPAFEARLRAAVARGELTGAEADLYRLYAVRAPGRLPPAYARGPGAGSRAGRELTVDGRELGYRCGTHVVRGVQRRLAQMPPDLRVEAESLIDPPRSTRPAGRRAAGKQTPGFFDTNRVDTANFSFQWEPGQLTNEDGSSPPSDDAPLWDGDPAVGGNEIPDVVERWAAYFEAALSEASRIVEPGEPERVFYGTMFEDGRIVVRIQGLGDGVYGVTLATSAEDPDSGEVTLDFVWMEVNRNLSFAPPNDEGIVDPDDPLARIHGAMKATASHELFHVMQFVWVDPAWLFSTEYSDDWWLESSATWVEDEVYDEVNDYFQFFTGPCQSREEGGEVVSGGWAQFVEAGIAFDVEAANACQIYGGVVFPKYLSEHVTGQLSMGQVWDRMRQGPWGDGLEALPALDYYAWYAAGFQGSPGVPAGLDGLYLGFSGSNASLETEYEEGAAAPYGEVPERGAIATAGDVTEHLPQLLGSTYYGEPRGSVPALTVAVANPDPVAWWGLSLTLEREASGSLLVLGAASEAGTPTLSLGGLAAGDRVRAGVGFLDFGSPAGFTLGASSVAPADAPPPTGPSSVTAIAVEGGLDLSWSRASAVAEVAGYAVRVAGPVTRTKAVLSPRTRSEVRELLPGVYTIEVAAYDAAEREAAPAQTTATVTTARAPLATPGVPIEDSHIVPPRSGSDHGIGQSIGFDKICFIGALGL